MEETKRKAKAPWGRRHAIGQKGCDGTNWREM